MANEFRIKNGLIVDQGTSQITGSLIVSGSQIITGSLNVSQGITGSLFGTASYATQALSASWAPGGSSTPAFPYTGSAQITGSLGITGSLNVTSQINIGSITGGNENTLVLGPPSAGGTGEGGQILLAASGGLYTSASMIDNYQNLTRILRGTNASSDAVVASWDMGTKQMQIPAYNSTASFTGSSVSMLSVDSNGYILTNNFTPYRYVNATQTTVTGTTAETIVATATINANTFNTNDVMKISFAVNKTAIGGTTNLRVKINTTNNIAGSTQIAVYGISTTNSSVLLQRTFSLNGGNLYGYPFATNAVTDAIVSAVAYNSTAYNTTNPLYVFFSLTNSSAADSASLQVANITN